MELYHILRSKPLATGRSTSNSHAKRPQPQGGGAGGNPHHREPHGGGGGGGCTMPATVLPPPTPPASLLRRHTHRMTSSKTDISRSFSSIHSTIENVRDLGFTKLSLRKAPGRHGRNTILHERSTSLTGFCLATPYKHIDFFGTVCSKDLCCFATGCYRSSACTKYNQRQSVGSSR